MSNPRPAASRSKSGKPGLRREGREAAVQFLFQLDSHGPDEAAPDDDFWRLRAGSVDPEEPDATVQPPPTAPKAKTFAEQLVHGVLSHRATIDALIVKFARNYELQRIAAVDRNILRLAVYEMMHNLEVPPVVAINEAIEIAKKFGSEESGRFVNGILDRIRSDEAIPARPPRQTTPKPA
ncbi:MAG: transcription antitermination factor NusB [Verrucomicrobiota bacterium]